MEIIPPLVTSLVVVSVERVEEEGLEEAGLVIMSNMEENDFCLFRKIYYR